MKIMKPELFLVVLFCLLSSFEPNYVTATSEAEEENEDAVGPTLPPLKLGMSICAFKADRGPCRARHTRYHFDIQTRQCEIFNYGGCEGNDNNFLTLEECQEKCIVPDLPEMIKRSRLKKEKPSYCLLENDPGICRGLITRYFYNKESQMCEKFQYGGCLGNPNNFLTLRECQDTCQDNFSALSDNSLQIHEENGAINNRTSIIKQELVLLPSVCMMKMDSGLCRANEKRYFYSYATGKCHPFSYSGCGGNENNFTSRKSCMQMCKKGFIQQQRQRGVMKIRRKRRKQRIRQMDEEIVIERI